MIREIRLHGVLKEQYGEIHNVVINDFRDIGNYFNYKGLVDGKLFTDDFEVNKYSLIVSDDKEHNEVLNDDTCGLPFTDNDLIIEIIPAIEGENNLLNLVQVVGGIALAGFGAATANPALIFQGLAIGSGGVAGFLSPAPTDSSAEFGSVLFEGQLNSNAQTSAVPLVYGQVLVGSIQISAGLEQADISEFGLIE